MEILISIEQIVSGSFYIMVLSKNPPGTLHNFFIVSQRILVFIKRDACTIPKDIFLRQSDFICLSSPYKSFSKNQRHAIFDHYCFQDCLSTNLVKMNDLFFF